MNPRGPEGYVSLADATFNAHDHGHDDHVHEDSARDAQASANGAGGGNVVPLREAPAVATESRLPTPALIYILGVFVAGLAIALLVSGLWLRSMNRHEEIEQ